MSEHSIIKSVNPQKVLEPEACLAYMHDDTEAQLLSRQHYAREVKKTVRLDQLNASKMSFQAKGEVEIALYIEEEVMPFLLPIKAIPAHVLEELGKAYNEAAGRIPRRWNPQAGEWDEKTQRYSGMWDQDQSLPEFREIAVSLVHLSRQLTIDKVLQGLDVTLYDQHGEMVWDHQRAWKVRERDKAIAALQYMGIGQPELLRIADAIDNLSIKAEVESEEAYSKNS